MSPEKKSSRPKKQIPKRYEFQTRSLFPTTPGRFLKRCSFLKTKGKRSFPTTKCSVFRLS
ncbi:hypothetical protein pdam_00004484 [Pocillopora damicornis]|uniref:Uncharacterized protein n=1 Tax=Pocillopora damicornis TaxID=46731 RepID=A0A3M6V2L5_POCDA|nr:hypothetical protein pdam_00004484 [Pocillopora damicornis]